MRWLLLTCFLLWARHGEGGALKCSPDSDATCLKENQYAVSEVPQAPESVSETEPECLDGSEWESNCHYCRCAGGVAECLKQSFCDPTIIEEPIRCKPNTTFQRDCNTCICLENGLGLCTLEFCRRSNVPTKASLPLGRDCAPGSSWRSRCNDCVCSPEGYGYCTEKACIGQDDEPLLRCAPDTLWKNDCNTCWCTSDGRAMCTRIGCGGNPGILNFNDGSDDKSESIDVQEPILKTSSKGNSTKKVCVENRMFIMNCNTCWCNEDGTSYFCTRKVCVPNFPDDPVVEEGTPELLRIIKRDCRPDEVFELDCNMCRCNADGKSFSCTRRACVDEDIKDIIKNETMIRKTRAAPQEPPKACQPGVKFRMDCNTCLCDNEGQDFSCTRIDCNALNNNNGGSRRKREVSKPVPADCVPGSVFDRDCNVCRCTDDGKHATCTIKRCNKEDSTPSTTESSFRCTPGEQFKQSCNDCTCSADGKSVFCSLFVCDDASP